VEFVESYYNKLKDRAVAYLNLDTAVTGTDGFDISGSPSFQLMVEDITKAITIDDSSGKTIYDVSFVFFFSSLVI
jgi:hypothetical protein